MKELERMFSKSERIVAKAKFTYWVFLRELLVAAILGGIIAVLWLFTAEINGFLKKEILTTQVLKYILLGAGCFVVLMTLIEALVRWRKEVIITDKKFVSRMGVININNAQLPLNEMKSVESKQNVFQRILRYGNVTVITDAQKPIVVKWIIQPEKFASKITTQKSQIESVDSDKLLHMRLVPVDYKRPR